MATKPAFKTGRTWTHEMSVVGLRFRWTREGRASLHHIAQKGAIVGVRLVREPDNKYDENAIMVMLPERLMEGRQLGYLHREVAALLAPKLDAKTLEVVSVTLTEVAGLDEDYQTATIIARFRDVPAKKAVGKRVTKT